MLLGSKRAFAHVTPTPLQLIALGSLAIGANTIFSWLSTSGLGVFNGQGLISYLLWPFLALIAGIFMAQRTGVAVLSLVPVLLWLSSDWLLALIQSGLQYAGQQPGWMPTWLADIMPTVFLLLFLWPNLMLLMLLARQNRWPWWEQGLILAGTAVALTIWQQAVINQPIFREVKAPDPGPQISENALYAQSDLLNEALAQIQPGRPGQVEWYFMGVAGAGYQNVFANEVNSVHTQFDTRFGTFGRSVDLINNINTQDTHPMATRTSIARTLNDIGQRMNRDEDVLFLFLTSHGNTGVFELANPPINMASIDPAWLRETLDQAGIRWRVIVISACYSGSFIPALQSPNTVIITAASADQASFGCENERDFTWFGKAFFLEGMNQQKSLTGAFEQANKQVTTWENREGYPPSQPQMRVGNGIARYLPWFERKLFTPQQVLSIPELMPPPVVTVPTAPMNGGDKPMPQTNVAATTRTANAPPIAPASSAVSTVPQVIAKPAHAPGDDE